MSQFIILLRSEDVDFSKFSPEEYQNLVADFEKWNDGLLKKGKLIGSANLKDGEGKTVKLKDGEYAIDGPYVETKEAVAGFFMVYADDYDEAVEYAKGCPFLPIGGSVEVRLVPDFEFEGLTKKE